MTLRTALAALFVLTLVAASAAEACSIPPEEPYVPARALVDRTKNIIVGDILSVRVTAGAPGHSGQRRYRVKLVEPVKGMAPATFEIVFHNHFQDTQQSIEKRQAQQPVQSTHETAAFWVGEVQEGATWPTCETVFDPSLGRHVIFLSKPYHVKSFEPITGADDSWYVTVKRMVADRKLQGRAVSPVEFVRLFYGVHRLACADKEGTRCREPARLWGERIDWHILAPHQRGLVQASTFDRTVCPPNAETGCRIAWMFFAEKPHESGVTLVHEGQPFDAPVINGKVALPKQHGDLVVTQTEVDERELMRAIAVQAGKPARP